MKGIERAWIRAAAPLALLALGCTPTLNWRTVEILPSGAKVMFPCRPAMKERPLSLDGQVASMRLWACDASGSTFALAELDVSAGSSPDKVLNELRSSSTGTIGGLEATPSAWRVQGSTRAERVVVTGHLPDGRAIVEHRASLVAATRVFRLSVIGTHASTDAADAFFAGFALPTR